MRRVGIPAVGVLVAIASLAGCATSSGSDFVVALPNGYQIKRSGKADEPMLVKKSGGLVAGPVTRYTVVRNVVLGQASPQEYFVLDTTSGEVRKGLAENDYKEALKTLNIASPPDLSPPVLPK
jgi:hypothetical protein